MTPHYDLKQQEKNNGVFLGLGWGGHKHFCHISGGESSMFFQRDWGGGSSKRLPTT